MCHQEWLYDPFTFIRTITTAGINQDILKLKLADFDTKLLVFGNVPYNISSQLIHYLVEQREYVEIAYLTLQREFAQKLIATPPSKSYGYMSCYLQYFACVRILFTIPRSAFSPQPGIDSSFVEIRFLPCSRYPVASTQLLFTLIKTAFSQRRKKIVNSLAALYPKDVLEEALRELEIDSGARADHLSLKDYCRIADYVDISSGADKRIA